MNFLNMFDMKDKISTVLSRNNNNILIGGGNSAVCEILKIIIGFILIIIGIIIFFMKEYWEKIEAKIINIYDTSNQCQVNISYKINDVIYYKNIVLPGAYTCSYSDKIDIYYNITNPNLILLDTSNYSIFAVVLIILGATTLYTINDL
jgi:hypothetical protein